MEERKYELVKNDMARVDGRILYRIKALIDFSYVDKGDLGGYIEKEENLSHDGSCWVYNNAKVFDDAKVYGDAEVLNNTKVCGSARVYGNAEVSGDARVYGNAEVSGDARIFGNAAVFGNAKVYDNAWVYDTAFACGDAKIHNNSQVFGSTGVYGDAEVGENAFIYGNSHVFDKATVSNSCIHGEAQISNNAAINSNSDYCSVLGFGSENGSTTFFKCADGTIKVNCSCFDGTLDEFREEMRNYGNSKYAKEYLAIADIVESKLSE